MGLKFIHVMNHCNCRINVITREMLREKEKVCFFTDWYTKKKIPINPYKRKKQKCYSSQMFSNRGKLNRNLQSHRNKKKLKRNRILSKG